MENLHNNKKLRAALRKRLADKRVDAEFWERYGKQEFQERMAEYLAACEKEGCDPNDHENGVYERYFQYVMDEEETAYYEEEEARSTAEDVAGFVLSHLQRGTRPWATAHRTDITDCVINLFRNNKYPTDSELIEAISAGLDKLTKPCRVRIEFRRPDLLRDSKEAPERLGRLLDIGWSESGLGVTLSLQDCNAEVLVEGRVTERPPPAFTRSVRDIVGQCTAIAGATHFHSGRAEAAVRTAPSSLVREMFGDDPMAPVLELDGPLSAVTINPDEPSYFDLGTVPVSTKADFVRLQYILSQVFVTEGNLGGPTRYEAGLRYAVWNLASIGVLGASPLAFIGCMAVAERCLSDLLGREGEPLGPFLTKRLQLHPDVSGNLDRLVQMRNQVIHDLTCPVSSADFWKARQLANTATHFLLAKLARTRLADAHNRPITLANAVRSILLTSENASG